MPQTGFFSLLILTTGTYTRTEYGGIRLGTKGSHARKLQAPFTSDLLAGTAALFILR